MDLDQAALARPVTGHAAVIDRPERVLEALDTAWSRALSRPHGPVNLTFPMDIQETPVAESELVGPTATPAAGSSFDAAERGTRGLWKSFSPGTESDCDAWSVCDSTGG